jgi:hypothetical protein
MRFHADPRVSLATLLAAAAVGVVVVGHAAAAPDPATAGAGSAWVREPSHPTRPGTDVVAAGDPRCAGPSVTHTKTYGDRGQYETSVTVCYRMQDDHDGVRVEHFYVDVPGSTCNSLGNVYAFKDSDWKTQKPNTDLTVLDTWPGDTTRVWGFDSDVPTMVTPTNARYCGWDKDTELNGPETGCTDLEIRMVPHFRREPRNDDEWLVFDFTIHPPADPGAC